MPRHVRVDERTLQERVPLLCIDTECVGQRDSPATHYSESSHLSTPKDGYAPLVDRLSTSFVSPLLNIVISGKETSLRAPLPNLIVGSCVSPPKSTKDGSLSSPDESQNRPNSSSTVTRETVELLPPNPSSPTKNHAQKSFTFRNFVRVSRWQATMSRR